MVFANVKKVGIWFGVFALLLSVATAAQAHDRWEYMEGKGSFAKVQRGNSWIEKTHLNTVYHFKEVKQTDEYVELYDAARDLSIRLFSDACYIQHRNTNGQFILLYEGGWVVQTEEPK